MNQIENPNLSYPAPRERTKMATTVAPQVTDPSVEKAKNWLNEANDLFAMATRKTICAADLNAAFKSYKKSNPRDLSASTTSKQLTRAARDLVLAYDLAWVKVFNSGIISRAVKNGLLVQDAGGWTHPPALMAQEWDKKIARLLALEHTPDSCAGWQELGFRDQCLWIEYIIALFDAVENPRQYGTLDFAGGVTKTDLMKTKLSNRDTLTKAIANCGIKTGGKRSHRLTKEDCLRIARYLYGHYKQVPKKDAVAAWAKGQLGVDLTSLPSEAQPKAKRK